MTESLLNKFEFVPFDTLSLEDIRYDLTASMNKIANVIKHIESTDDSSWDNVLKPLYEPLYHFMQVWRLVGLYEGVMDTPEIRLLNEEFQPIITDFFLKLGQNKHLYQHIQNIKQQDYFTLNEEQRRIIDCELRDFFLSGISLAPEVQQEFKQIQAKLTELQTKFEQNVLDSTDDFVKYVSKEELNGIPDDVLEMYRVEAIAAGKDGLYKITLHSPSYTPIMQLCSNRELRKELHHAHAMRASEIDPRYDNHTIIQEILRLRYAKAKMLGFNNFSELSLYTKMADDNQQVLTLLYDLASKSREIAIKESEELCTFAKKIDKDITVEAWDISYYSEKLQQEKYSFSSQELKEYFQLPVVMQGLFELIYDLYAIEFKEVTDIAVWHKDVMVYRVERNNEIIGYCYFDLYTREGKQSGAWMNSMQDRHFSDGFNKLPIIYVVCNFAHPVGDKPSLLSLDDVQTIFHEIGHGLHQLLTVVDSFHVSGINEVEWDAVELPSQLMEYFTWNYSVLQSITKHVKTGLPLPTELYDKLINARYYHAGLHTLRQIGFSIGDMLVHGDGFDPYNDDYRRVVLKLRDDLSVLRKQSYGRLLNSFSHIFAGGYAAGYYSYKWAEILACDVFALFDGADKNQLRQIGSKFERDVLSQGGVRNAMHNFVKFMGREPKIEALLKYTGLSN